jgi:iron complex outermembrane receptor protein
MRISFVILYFAVYSRHARIKKGQTMAGAWRAVGLALFATWPVAAETAASPASATDVFELGQIVVTGTRAPGVFITSSTLSAPAIELFNRNSLDQAVALIPGVNASNSGGSRNEQLIFLRGFDRFQVPLSIDGIRVYLPADNRLDFGRFLTADIAEVQVAKGYASVLDGPGAMGGAINLVSLKPARELEAEARGQLSFDRNVAQNGYNLFGRVGTRQERWYAQASFARNERDFFTLSDDFVPTPNQPAGRRLRSDTEDWRVNAKIGFTPNATDEYALSYTRQEGSKNAPLETTFPLPVQRYWSWPYWNLDSLYFLSTTALGDRATLRTRIYRNSFSNLLRSFDDASQSSQTLPRAFNSYYDDEASGGSAQLDLEITNATRLSIAGFYRRDRHTEYQQVFPSGATEPRQNSVEDTWSAAVEVASSLSPTVEARVGLSYDWRDLRQAEDYAGVPGTPGGTFIQYQRRNADALNAQAQIVWRPEVDTELRARVSSRARFPTLFERFSSRFGGATSAPDLQSERATQFELGGSRTFAAVRAEAAIWYARLTDVIVAVPIIFAGQPVTQSRNVGSGDFYGGEVTVSARVSDRLTLGGNYSYTERDVTDPSNVAFRPTGVPVHKAFLYAEWQPLTTVAIIPSLEMASDRWLVNTQGTRWFRDGSHVLANLRVNFTLRQRLEAGIGVQNLFDRNYQLASGFPEPGRSFFATLRAGF